MLSHECASNALESSRNEDENVWRILTESPEVIYNVSGRAFYIQAHSNVDIRSLSKTWHRVGCTPIFDSGSDASKFRHKQCIANMERWVNFVNSDQGSMDFLLNDEDYRRVCLRDE